MLNDLKNKTIHGFAIIGQCLSFFRRSPICLLFLLLAIVLISGAIALAAVALYHIHGIHILDARTLEKWWLLSFWEQSILTASLLAPLYFSSELILLFTNTALTRYLVPEDGKQCGILASLGTAIKTIPRILEWTWAKTIWRIIREPYIKKLIKRKILARWAQRLHHQTVEANWFEHTFLVLPIMALTIQKPYQASNNSSLLIEQKFGPRAAAQFSLFILYSILALLVAVPLAYLISSSTNPALGITIFFVIMGAVTALIETSLSILKLDTYQYCNNQKTLFFSADFIKKSFK